MTVQDPEKSLQLYYAQSDGRTPPYVSLPAHDSEMPLEVYIKNNQ